MLEASRSCCRQSASLRPHPSCSFFLSHTITWQNGVVQNSRTANRGVRRRLTGTEQKVSFALHESFLALIPTQTPSELSRETATVAQIQKSGTVSPHTSCVAEIQRLVIRAGGGQSLSRAATRRTGGQGKGGGSSISASSPPASAAVTP